MFQPYGSLYLQKEYACEHTGIVTLWLLIHFNFNQSMNQFFTQFVYVIIVSNNKSFSEIETFNLSSSFIFKCVKLFLETSSLLISNSQHYFYFSLLWYPLFGIFLFHELSDYQSQFENFLLRISPGKLIRGIELKLQFYLMMLSTLNRVWKPLEYKRIST